MSVRFRQSVHPGDTGKDVLAYKRAFRAMGLNGAQDLALTTTAGPAFVGIVRAIEYGHGLLRDGIIGPRVHAIVAPFFDARARWLYDNATLRRAQTYVSPFRLSSGLVIGRIDQGVDYHGYGAIGAIGKAEIVGLGGNGWPGGEYLLYKLQDGIHAGRHVYVAEAIIPHVAAGQQVAAGQTICTFGPGAAPGTYPGIETGWGSHVVNETLAAAEGNSGGIAHANSPAGLAFARFLHAIGAPAPYVGEGPTYTLAGTSARKARAAT